MPDSTKRAWVKPAVTEFATIDALREHLEAKATTEAIPAIEAMIDQLRKRQGVGGGSAEPRARVAARRL